MNKIKIARVSFNKIVDPLKNQRTSKQSYDYYTDITDLHPGSVVVVQIKEGYGLAIFEDYVIPPNPPTKWIISRADLVKDNTFRQLEKDKEQLMQKIEERERLFKNISRRKLLAYFDPKLDGLLKEFANLSQDGSFSRDVTKDIETIKLQNSF